MEHIWEIIGLIAGGGGCGTLLGWFLSKKKYNAEVEGVRVQNFDAALEAYKKMYEDMISDLNDKVAGLQAENASLKEELSENRKQILTLTNFVLASAMKRADGNSDFTELKEILK